MYMKKIISVMLLFALLSLMPLPSIAKTDIDSNTESQSQTQQEVKTEPAVLQGGVAVDIHQYCDNWTSEDAYNVINRIGNKLITANNVDKKIKLLNTIQKELQSRKNEEIPPLYLDSNFEGVIMKKWKKTQQMYIFLLSNKNIQCLFYDKSQVIFFCGNNRKMKYINEDGKEDEYICDNFTNLRCEDENVKKKIEAAIAELKK